MKYLCRSFILIVVCLFLPKIQTERDISDLVDDVEDESDETEIQTESDDSDIVDDVKDEFVTTCGTENQTEREISDIEDDEEDEFVKIYGNDKNTSGIWEPVRSFAEDRDKLMNVSLQVHRAAKMDESNDEIDEVIFDTRTLVFTHGGYKDIQFDLIKYNTKRAPKPQQSVYVGKGMEPACVHLLIRVDPQAMYFFLGKHVCDITF